jgi:CD109 antigen
MDWPMPMPPAAAGEARRRGREPPARRLAEVQRIRQYFPETWIWTEVMTDAQGRATLPVEAPDSITTWVLRAVALSQEQGLGVAEGGLIVLQPFFIQVDLPYSAVRGEEFPVKVALYNYLDEPQEFLVEMEGAGWFEALGDSSGSVTVGPNDVGGIEFVIQPGDLGVDVVTARSRRPLMPWSEPDHRPRGRGARGGGERRAVGGQLRDPLGTAVPPWSWRARRGPIWP